MLDRLAHRLQALVLLGDLEHVQRPRWVGPPGEDLGHTVACGCSMQQYVRGRVYPKPGMSSNRRWPYAGGMGNQRVVGFGARSIAAASAARIEPSSAVPVPAMSKAVPWSMLVRMYGSPTVMFAPASKPSTLIGPWPWS